MDVKRNGSQPSSKGPADSFRGIVRIDPLFQPHPPARTSAATVTFEPGAAHGMAHAPAWSDVDCDGGLRAGRRWEGPVETICPGDVVWFPPDEKHWHGRATNTPMTHIAIQEQLDGKAVDWMEQVTNEQYG